MLEHVQGGKIRVRSSAAESTTYCAFFVSFKIVYLVFGEVPPTKRTNINFDSCVVNPPAY
eukprot:2709913-Amphidinium_carterae.1